MDYEIGQQGMESRLSSGGRGSLPYVYNCILIVT